MRYEPKRRDIKIIISGDIVEYYEYLNPISVEPKTSVNNRGVNEEKRIDNLFRARAEIRRIIWQNITPFSKFITLTYAHTCLDYDKVIYDFKIFIKRLNRMGFKNFKYLYVIEHQKERGIKECNDGSYHIHCVLFYDDFLPYEIINKAWGNGATHINCIEGVNNVGAYVCKYLTKEDFNILEKNSYHISRGLKKPQILAHDGYITDPDFCKELLHDVDFYYCKPKKIEFNSSDGSKITNNIIYKQGRLKRRDSIDKK